MEIQNVSRNFMNYEIIDENDGCNSKQETVTQDYIPKSMEGIAELYLQGLRDDIRTTSSMSSIRRLLIAHQGKKLVDKMKQQADKVLSSGIFQGVVSIASSIVTAVTAGVSAGASSAAGSAASATKGAATSVAEAAKSATKECVTKIATKATEEVAKEVAKEATKVGARQIVKEIFLKSGPEFTRTIGNFDGWKIEADKLEYKKQEVLNRKNEEESARGDLSARIGRLTQSQSRVIQIMERNDQLEDEGKRVVLSKL